MKRKVYMCGYHICSGRSLDTRKIYNYLIKNGYIIVSKPEKADFIILNTCAYRDEIAKKSLSKVNEFKKYDAELIVIGCLPEIKKEELNEIFDGKLIGTKEIDKITEIFKNKNIDFGETEDGNILWQNINKREIRRKLEKIVSKNHPHFIFSLYDFKHSIIKKIFGEFSNVYESSVLEDSTYYLRVSHGCYGNCSYCAIKKAIGPLKSKPMNVIINEFKKGLEMGYKRFRIGADDVGSFGFDIKSNFIKLLEEIHKVPGDYQIEIEYISPRWIIKYLNEFEKYLNIGKISYIFSSIQSANNRVLGLMSRYYTKEDIINVFNRLKKYPNIKIGTEIIVGFPTETIAEFRESLNFIIENSFDFGFINAFSCIKGVPAEKIESHISNEEIHNRMIFSKKTLRDSGNKVIVYHKEKKTPLTLKFYKD